MLNPADFGRVWTGTEGDGWSHTLRVPEVHSSGIGDFVNYLLQRSNQGQYFYDQTYSTKSFFRVSGSGRKANANVFGSCGTKPNIVGKPITKQSFCDMINWALIEPLNCIYKHTSYFNFIDTYYIPKYNWNSNHLSLRPPLRTDTSGYGYLTICRDITPSDLRDDGRNYIDIPDYINAIDAVMQQIVGLKNIDVELTTYSRGRTRHSDPRNMSSDEFTGDLVISEGHYNTYFTTGDFYNGSSFKTRLHNKIKSYVGSRLSVSVLTSQLNEIYNMIKNDFIGDRPSDVKVIIHDKLSIGDVSKYFWDKREWYVKMTGL